MLKYPVPLTEYKAAADALLYFIPTLHLIQQGTSKGGIFPHLVVGLALSELKVGLISPKEAVLQPRCKAWEYFPW